MVRLGNSELVERHGVIIIAVAGASVTLLALDDDEGDDSDEDHSANDTTDDRASGCRRESFFGGSISVVTIVASAWCGAWRVWSVGRVGLARRGRGCRGCTAIVAGRGRCGARGAGRTTVVARGRRCRTAGGGSGTVGAGCSAVAGGRRGSTVGSRGRSAAAAGSGGSAGLVVVSTNAEGRQVARCAAAGAGVGVEAQEGGALLGPHGAAGVRLPVEAVPLGVIADGEVGVDLEGEHQGWVLVDDGLVLAVDLDVEFADSGGELGAVGSAAKWVLGVLGGGELGDAGLVLVGQGEVLRQTGGAPVAAPSLVGEVDSGAGDGGDGDVLGAQLGDYSERGVLGNTAGELLDGIGDGAVLGFVALDTGTSEDLECGVTLGSGVNGGLVVLGGEHVADHLEDLSGVLTDEFLGLSLVHVLGLEDTLNGANRGTTLSGAHGLAGVLGGGDETSDDLAGNLTALVGIVNSGEGRRGLLGGRDGSGGIGASNSGVELFDASVGSVDGVSDGGGFNAEGASDDNGVLTTDLASSGEEGNITDLVENGDRSAGLGVAEVLPEGRDLVLELAVVGVTVEVAEAVLQGLLGVEVGLDADERAKGNGVAIAGGTGADSDGAGAVDLAERANNDGRVTLGTVGSGGDDGDLVANKGLEALSGDGDDLASGLLDDVAIDVPLEGCLTVVAYNGVQGDGLTFVHITDDGDDLDGRNSLANDLDVGGGVGSLVVAREGVVASGHAFEGAVLGLPLLELGVHGSGAVAEAVIGRASPEEVVAILWLHGGVLDFHAEAEGAFADDAIATNHAELGGRGVGSHDDGGGGLELGVQALDGDGERIAVAGGEGVRWHGDGGTVHLGGRVAATDGDDCTGVGPVGGPSDAGGSGLVGATDDVGDVACEAEPLGDVEGGEGGEDLDLRDSGFFVLALAQPAGEGTGAIGADNRGGGGAGLGRSRGAWGQGGVASFLVLAAGEVRAAVQLGGGVAAGGGVLLGTRALLHGGVALHVGAAAERVLRIARARDVVAGT